MDDLIGLLVDGGVSRETTRRLREARFTERARETVSFQEHLLTAGAMFHVKPPRYRWTSGERHRGGDTMFHVKRL